jgi:hypothetical protein
VTVWELLLGGAAVPLWLGGFLLGAALIAIGLLVKETRRG